MFCFLISKHTRCFHWQKKKNNITAKYNDEGSVAYQTKNSDSDTATGLRNASSKQVQTTKTLGILNNGINVKHRMTILYHYRYNSIIV